MGQWAVRLNLEIDEGFDEPLEVIQGIVDSSASIERSLAEWVAIARRKGHTWEEIGKALRVSRQSAWERFASSERKERKRVISEVLGSFKGRLNASLEEIRRIEREEEYEREVRKWGSSPPGLRWRS